MILDLVSNNKHPISTAITIYLEGLSTTPAKISDIKTIARKNIKGKIDSKLIHGGNAR